MECGEEGLGKHDPLKARQEPNHVRPWRPKSFNFLLKAVECYSGFSATQGDCDTHYLTDAPKARGAVTGQ